MNDFTDFEHIAIENAYEELLLILKEQGENKDFSVALEEAVYIHDLSENREVAILAIIANEDSPYYWYDS